MKTLKALVFLFIISSCSFNHDEGKAPARVNGVPEQAFWVGGVGGGNWFLVDKVHDHKNNAVIKVYNDNDGSLIVSKHFMLICPTDNQMLIEDLQKQINGFDGEKVLLKSPNGKKGCWLQ
jgi:hypothetical protein